MRRFSLSILLLLSVTIALSACGYRGALYLPEDAPTPAPEASPAASSEQGH